MFDTNQTGWTTWTSTRVAVLATLLGVLGVLGVLGEASGSAVNATPGDGPVTVCYVGVYAIYRQGRGKFEPENIDARLCSHLIYLNVGVTEQGGVQILDDYQDLPSGLNGYNRFLALRTANPNAKFLISIGGLNQGSATFSKVANDATLRATFAKNAVDFVTQYGFDGLDLDWEYPAQRGGVASDKNAYTQLLRELRTALSAKNLLLTVAVSVRLGTITVAYDVPAMMQYVDLVNLMAFDLHDAYEGYTGMNAALRATTVEALVPTTSNLNVAAAVNLWLQRGADPKKLVLGVPFNGITFTLSVPGINGVGVPTQSAGNPRNITTQAGFITYFEVCDLPNQGIMRSVYDNVRKVPYGTYEGNQWTSYENANSIALKASLAVELGLAGVMAWSLESDDFHGDCPSSGGAYPLLRAVYRTLYGAEPPSTTA